MPATSSEGPCIACGRSTVQELMFDRQAVRVCPECEWGQGVRCPVQCGRCCAELWRQVTDSRGQTLYCHAHPREGKCPHQGPLSCSLDRSEMPYSCRLWVCELGLRVLRGALTLEDARLVVLAGEQ